MYNIIKKQKKKGGGRTGIKSQIQQKISKRDKYLNINSLNNFKYELNVFHVNIVLYQAF